jgi:CHAD domain-containing protein
MTDRIIEYFLKHRQIVEENLELSKDPQDIEAIHNMRLSVKRIRVVARLAEMISEGMFSKKEQLKSINRFFKVSGRLRDTQVTKNLFIELGHPELKSVVKLLTEREHKERMKYETVLEGFDIGCLQDFENALIEKLANMNEKKVLQAGYLLLSELEIEIHELFHGSDHEKRMHDIRTRLKDINYLNNMFNEILPVSDHMNISPERLRELGEIAGAWHDSLNLETKLYKFVGKNPSEAETLQNVISELKIKKQGLYQEYSCILINEVKV